MKRYQVIIWLCLTAGMIILAFNKHMHTRIFTYHSEIWGDKAGYYVYLPALFYYDFNPQAFPENIEEKTGKGFSLDTAQDKIITKYTCGIAILQTPFFLGASALDKIINDESSAFTLFHHRSVDVAATFYLILGLFFLYSFLRYYYSSLTCWCTILLILFATNLFYYSISETGMSHVYSFFCFSAYLFLLKKTNFLKQRKGLHLIVFGLLAGLIILIRPTNLLFLLIYFLLDVNSKQEFLSRIRRVMHFKPLLMVAGAAFIVLLPQLLYWKYAFDTYLSYSYGDEGFHWLEPKLLHVWASPLNGLFLYTPFVGVMLLSMLWMLKSKRHHSYILLGYFLLISYVFSCWWCWWFGCALGGRSFIEYYTLFSLSVAYLVQKIVHQRAIRWYLVGLFIAALFITFNIVLTYNYEHCIYVASYWDYNDFVKAISGELN